VKVVCTLDDLSSHTGGCLVPTMGALHEGHASLIDRGVRAGMPVVVSIFVNPTQFGPAEDFDRYPRTLEADLEICERHGAEAAWTPSVEDLYPDGAEAARAAANHLRLPPVATTPRLEDGCRAGHFAGVAQVVSRLFDLARPALSVFGEKDFQQLRLIEELVETDRRGERRWPHLRILRGDTVREADGLAMSSRNRYLSPDDRSRAVGISKALQTAHAAQQPATAENLMAQTLEAHGLEVEYAVVRDPANLMPVDDLRGPTRALIAARLGEVRLIDNAPLPAWP
jgi:pantoate--beta-alanine ligase